MKVRWVKSHKLAGGVMAVAGEVADVNPNEAQTKIKLGLAQPVAAAPAAPAGEPSGGPQHREPRARHGDPAPRKKEE
ncbi:MAG TPA: hypothetical protein VIV56_07330 [Gemmatimonadales bacterium]